MANIKVVVEKPIADGYKLKFRTPCGSNAIEGLDVKYPAKNGVGTLIKKFVFKYAQGTELSGVGNLFVSGVMIEVLLDVTHSVAYIQNADTNSYVESVKSDIKRLEESHKQFWDVASKAVDDAVERAESVQGVYVGSGDMPEGYSVQIDPDGDCVTVDTELDETSGSPVANSVITRRFASVDTSIAEAQNQIDTLNKMSIDQLNTLNMATQNIATNAEQIDNLLSFAENQDWKIRHLEGRVEIARTQLLVEDVNGSNYMEWAEAAASAWDVILLKIVYMVDDIEHEPNYVAHVLLTKTTAITGGTNVDSYLGTAIIKTKTGVDMKIIEIPASDQGEIPSLFSLGDGITVIQTSIYTV